MSRGADIELGEIKQPPPDDFGDDDELQANESEGGTIESEIKRGTYKKRQGGRRDSRRRPKVDKDTLTQKPRGRSRSPGSRQKRSSKRMERTTTEQGKLVRRHRNITRDLVLKVDDYYEAGQKSRLAFQFGIASVLFGIVLGSALLIMTTPGQLKFLCSASIGHDQLCLYSLKELFRNAAIEAAHSTVSIETECLKYVDEDGDIITLKNDADTTVMVKTYFSYRSDFPDGIKLIVHDACALSKSHNGGSGSPSPRRVPLRVRCDQTHQLRMRGEHDFNDQRCPSAASEHLQTGSPTLHGISLDIDSPNLGLVFERQIGYGASSVVHKAFHKLSKRHIAVKLLTADPSPEAQSAFAAELSVLRHCSHPALVDFHSAFVFDDRIAICVELMNRGSLKRFIPIAGREPTLSAIVTCLVGGLQYLWNNNILHRDIKPSNVLLNSSGVVKVCDFGFSKQLHDSIARSFVGTTAYMSPERIRGDEYRNSSEVWSLGILVFETVTGRWPFGANELCDNPIEFFHAVQTMAPPHIQNVAQKQDRALS